MNPPSSSLYRRPWRATLVGLLALTLGIGLAIYFVRTKTVPPVRPAVPIAPGVQVIRPRPHTGPVPLAALGTISAKRRITLRAQVGGMVEEVSPRLEPGTLVRRGEVLVRIDPRDYAATVTLREAELAQAQAALQLEAGRRQAAQADWDRLEPSLRGPDPKLPLRDPQWAEAQAAVRKAEANLAAARLNLERTQIRAPFDAIVEQSSVHRGSTVTVQDALAVLTDAEAFWITITLPLEHLAWLDLPQEGATQPTAWATSPAGVRAPAVIQSILPQVEAAGRLAQVLLRLPRPLAVQPPFLVGDTVQVAISGKSAHGMLLPRETLREGNTVWLAENSTLAVRPVTVLWTDATTALVQGLSPDDLVIRSALSAPIPGMALTVMEEAK